MKIEQSNILMASERYSTTRVEERENLSIIISPSNTNRSRDEVTISDHAKCMAKDCENLDSDRTKEDMESPKMLLKRLLAEVLSGRKVRLLDPSDSKKIQENSEIHHEPVSQGEKSNSQGEGWGISYDYQKSHYERESVSFSAAGIIKTADNREITFALNLDMDREYLSHESFSFRAGDAALVDPLVINFNGTAAQLSDMKFAFDLDSNGVEEEIPVLGPGSGFLVIDANRDGQVNNGSELFGPQTGNGFLELSAHDLDANNWIDENDPVYEQLHVWTMNSEGGSNLRSLKEAGIGAINTSSISTRFDLRGGNNQLLGQTAGTGVYFWLYKFLLYLFKGHPYVS